MSYFLIYNQKNYLIPFSCSRIITLNKLVVFCLLLFWILLTIAIITFMFVGYLFSIYQINKDDYTSF